jgi:hypothetical protein
MSHSAFSGVCVHPSVRVHNAGKGKISPRTILQSQEQNAFFEGKFGDALFTEGWFLQERLW